MLKNYWKVAVRNLFKVKGYTLINITGLTVGITCFILIMLYVKYEMSYDSFHENNDRIYRVAINLPSWNFRGSTDFALASGILAPTLMDEYREVQRATRFTTVDGLIAYGDKRFIHQGIVADEYFLDVFTFALIEGKKRMDELTKEHTDRVDAMVKTKSEEIMSD